jgi:hypothetical protein
LADVLSLRVPSLYLLALGIVIRLVIEREKVDATNGKIIVSRELLGALLDNLEKRGDPTPLSPHERESLQQLAVTVMSEDDEIAISRELLEKWGSGRNVLNY